MEANFAKARIEKIIRNVGAQRVSAGALNAMDEVLNAYGSDLARNALKIANQSGRKTISEDDVKRAAEK